MQKKKPSPFDFLKFLGPGLLVTVGFIDPGNWASNLVAGASYGYALLWIVTLSTIMLIILQHNVAHLGIVSGLCLSEATTRYVRKPIAVPLLLSAMMASVATSLAEILGASIALQMLFAIPLRTGAILSTLFILSLLLTNGYKTIEKAIVALVSLIGLSFLYELALVDIDWGTALQSSIQPAFPPNAMIIIMSVLGAVVMPHNFFLHSEIIQSRQWNLENEAVIERQLKYEFLDTFTSMCVGWAINSAMILLAATTFFKGGLPVTELEQAQKLLIPLLGEHASVIFAVALLLSGLSSCITSGMAAGCIWGGLFNEAYDSKSRHTRTGIILSLLGALLILFFIRNPLQGLIYSQMALSIQLPFTIFLQISLTSSAQVMGKYKNGTGLTALLVALGLIVSLLNVVLLISFFRGAL